MTVIFSTLDNAVTLTHASGSFDIGQWPRLVLALSGLIAGVVFDIFQRKYMMLVMYLIAGIAVIGIIVLGMGASVLVGLLIFYVSAGFFVVFFTTSFMDISYHMKRPQLWAGMGRAINNFGAIIMSALSINLLVNGNYLVLIITGVCLLGMITLTVMVFGQQRVILLANDDENQRIAKFIDNFNLTTREAEVLATLAESSKSIGEIASELAISRSVLYRHIDSMGEKTGTANRKQLLHLYRTWK